MYDGPTSLTSTDHENGNKLKEEMCIIFTDLRLYVCVCVFLLYLYGCWNVTKTTTIQVLTHAPQNISNIFLVCVCLCV